MVFIVITLVLACFASILIAINMFIPYVFVIVFERILLFFSQWTSKSIQLDDDLTCSYIERGSVATTEISVLFIHGYSDSSTYYTPFPKLFTQKHHLVAIDLLNHGKSTCIAKDVDTWDLVEFVKKFVEMSDLKTRKFHIVGVSMGGQVTAFYATKYPDDLVSSTLVCPAGVAPNEDQEETEPHLWMKNNKGRLIFKSDAECKHLLYLIFNDKSKLPPNILINAIRDYKERDAVYTTPVYNGVLHDYHLTDKILKKIRDVPVMVVWGTEDKVLHKEGAEYIREHIPTAKVEYIPGAGHNFTMTHLEQFENIYNSWIAQFVN